MPVTSLFFSMVKDVKEKNDITIIAKNAFCNVFMD